MFNLKNMLAELARTNGRSPLIPAMTPHYYSPPRAQEPAQLAETSDFGSNPGNLRMLSYCPPSTPRAPALLVVLHGCHQTAAGYNHGAGWSALADRYGFILLFPEQQRSNNPNGCFDWFHAADTLRDHGEVLSIRQMIEKIASEREIDRDRIFITGLSAGGAMTSAMLACYPEVFAGGAIIAGLPYGAATSIPQAFESMSKSPARSSQAWGDLIRRASGHQGPWPRISIWHGNADTTVVPSNAREILKQWTDVHALPPTPSRENTVSGYLRQVWISDGGDELIESYAIPGMAHGTPLAVGAADDQGGAAGPFFLDVGISSSYHTAKFFGLTAAIETHSRQIPTAREREPARKTRTEWRSTVPIGKPLNGETDTPLSDRDRGVRRPFDVGAVITKALTAAGLMKGR